MRRLHWLLLLPLFLLFAQQGQLRHEVSHLAKPAQSCVKETPANQDHCSLCLAFGHLSDTAKPDAAPVQLSTDLAYAFAFDVATADASLEALTPRSRGPPAP